MEPTPNLSVAEACLREAVRLIKNGEKEDVVRHSFTDHLGRMFNPRPWWVVHHVLGSEANASFTESGKNRRGFIDNLVGLTAIEYESDLTIQRRYEKGYSQVRQYCASLLNEGYAPDLVEGILSDTVRWRVYKIKSMNVSQAAIGKLSGDDVELALTDELDLSQAGEREAKQLVDFLTRYLGREGARPLSAHTLAVDLGLESQFCAEHTSGLQNLVDHAFNTDAKYAQVIETLWCDFVLYLGDQGTARTFDRQTYIRELYILTLAKLLCANVIEGRSLLSNDAQLSAILNGSYFNAKGLINLVEYDYFGWLNEGSRISQLLPIAREMQDDLRAYDFASTPAEDLFGQMMAQLALSSRRLLLGQEWTPTWLAARIVEKVFDMIPPGEDPHLVDTCCGSGAMIVEAIKLAKRRMARQGIGSGEVAAMWLSQIITGFDVDPLAVMLSKIGWTLAARDWLGPLDGSYRVTIPIYQADSLFAATPLSTRVDQELDTGVHTLQLAEQSVALPSFLVAPQYQALFDGLLERGYAVAMEAARQAPTALSEVSFQGLAEAVYEDLSIDLDVSKRETIPAFLSQLVKALDALQRDGRNGIWAFILRNSYRPGLVSGQFNGVVTNPPWLALSKVADNPYKAMLRQRAEAFAIKPTGSSHLHIELATIFLLHAVDRYLQPGAAFGCVLPDTVLTGHQHNPFRMGKLLTAPRAVGMHIQEIWRVGTGAFKNEAIVVYGQKNYATSIVSNPVPGQLVNMHGSEPLAFRIITQGSRVAWSDNPSASSGSGFFNPASFRQGADIMPRTLIFHDARVVSGADAAARWQLGPIDRSTGPFRYLVADAKKMKGFHLTAGSIPDRFMFDVLLSNHLSAFDLAATAKAFLPIEKNAAGRWVPCTPVTLATWPAVRAAFQEVVTAFGANNSIADYFLTLDVRNKLTQQSMPQTGYLVFTGAGGGTVCAAYAEATLFPLNKLIVDQTLYWAAVNSEDEAIYLVGLLNSEAVNDVIREFQPRGQFGERHVHQLPFGVTPKYDPDNAGHDEVVTTTRALLAEWNFAKAGDANITKLLDPNMLLSVRRRSIRAKIAALRSYKQYDLACRDLYGL